MPAPGDGNGEEAGAGSVKRPVFPGKGEVALYFWACDCYNVKKGKYATRAASRPVGEVRWESGAVLPLLYAPMCVSQNAHCVNKDGCL